MNDTIKEITRMIDENCKGCEVAKLIQKNHGYQSKLEYCQSCCIHGKKMDELQREVNFGNLTKIGLECNEENYLYHKRKGMTDKAICEKFGISQKTLIRRKEFWGIEKKPPKNKLDDKTPEEYLQLKKSHLSDQEVAKKWKCGKSTLVRWKKEHGLKGFLYLAARTKEEYLELKVKGLTDVEIARKWQIWRRSLYDWKRQHNLRGGL